MEWQKTLLSWDHVKVNGNTDGFWLSFKKVSYQNGVTSDYMTRDLENSSLFFQAVNGPICCHCINDSLTETFVTLNF